MNWTLLSKEWLALFAIVDPVGAIPLFLATTAGWSALSRRRVGWVAAGSMGALLFLVAVLGTRWLDFFGVSLPAFMVGGGLLLLLMAIDMLRATPSPTRHTPEEDVEAATGAHHAVGVVPLGIPLLAGPAAISHVVIQTTGPHATPFWTMALAIAGLVVVAGTVFTMAEQVRRAVGAIGMNVVSRLMGIMLAAIAVETMARGALHLFPGLMH